MIQDIFNNVINPIIAFCWDIINDVFAALPELRNIWIAVFVIWTVYRFLIRPVLGSDNEVIHNHFHYRSNSFGSGKNGTSK